MDQILSTIRIWVAGMVTMFLTWVVSLTGVEIPKDTNSIITGAIMASLIAIYYYVARVLSEKWPIFKWLLGIPRLRSLSIHTRPLKYERM